MTLHITQPPLEPPIPNKQTTYRRICRFLQVFLVPPNDEYSDSQTCPKHHKALSHQTRLPYRAQQRLCRTNGLQCLTVVCSSFVSLAVPCAFSSLNIALLVTLLQRLQYNTASRERQQLGRDKIKIPQEELRSYSICSWLCFQ